MHERVVILSIIRGCSRIFMRLTRDGADCCRGQSSGFKDVCGVRTVLRAYCIERILWTRMLMVSEGWSSGIKAAETGRYYIMKGGGGGRMGVATVKRSQINLQRRS